MNSLLENNPKYLIFYTKGYGTAKSGAQSSGFRTAKSILEKKLTYKLIIVSDQTAKKVGNEILYRHKLIPFNTNPLFFKY